MKIPHIFVSLLLLAGAIFFIKYRIDHKPAPDRKAPEQVVPRVETLTITAGDVAPVIEASGVVRAKYTTELRSEIAGAIIGVAPTFEAGSRVDQGKRLAQIDPRNYQATVSEASNRVAQAELQLAEEELRAEQAKRDWSRSGREGAPSDFTLRVPHLRAARTALAAAKQNLIKTLTDLERTEIKAPYQAMVLERQVSPGDYVSPGTLIATLLEPGNLEVLLSISLTEYQLLQLDDQPREIELVGTDDVQHPAQLVRVVNQMDERNRTIQLFAEPKQHTLLPGTFVQAHIPALPIANIFRIPQTASVRESFIWVVDEQNQLRRQSIELLYTESDDYLIRIPDQDTVQLAIRPSVSFREGMNVEPAEVTSP